MARFRTDLAVNYVNDFDNSSPIIIPFKIAAAAPIPENFYVPRPVSNPCGKSTLPFEVRYLNATFVDVGGVTGTFKYPVPVRRGGFGILEVAKALNALGASCIDYVGEKWLYITNNIFTGTEQPNYRNTPYENIPGEPTKQSYTYTYDSDIVEVGQQIGLSTSVETEPIDLREAQLNCLAGLQEKEGITICSGQRLQIEPRKFYIQAIAKAPTDNVPRNTVSRQAIVSSEASAQKIGCALGLAPAAYCLGYEGERIKNLQNSIAL